MSKKHSRGRKAEKPKKVTKKVKLPAFGKKLHPRLYRLLSKTPKEIREMPVEKRVGIRVAESGQIRARILVKFERKADPALLKGCQIHDLRKKWALIEAPFDIIKELANNWKVRYVDLPGPLHPDLLDAVTRSGAPPIDPNDGQELTGSGVLIGIVDSGIDYLSKDFAVEENGQDVTRIKYILEIDANGERSWDENQINQAIRSPDPYGIVNHQSFEHGTLVTACATSNGRETGRKGVAPGASIMMAKISTGNLEEDVDNGYLVALIRLIEKSGDFNMPLVINLSKGTNDGPHDGRLPFEEYLDQLLQDNPNVILCKSAGNEGNKNLHAMGNVLDDNQDPMNPQPPTFEVLNDALMFFKTEVWFTAPSTMSLEVIDPEGDTTGRFNPGEATPDYDPNNPGSPISLPSGNTVSISSQIDHPYNGDGNITIEISAATSQNVIQGQWQLVLRPVNVQPGEGDYHIWMSRAARERAKFVAPHQSDDFTIAAGATGDKPIVVGAHQDDIRELAPFSSRGPTRDGRIKPDITAPGFEIVGTRARQFNTAQMDNPNITIMNGTSFSTPMVAGTCALLIEQTVKQGGSPPTNDQILALLTTYADKDSFSGLQPNNSWGHGKLSIQGSVSALPRANAVSFRISPEPAEVVTGRALALVVEAVDATGRVDENYNGTVELLANFLGPGAGNAGLPPAAQLINGYHRFEGVTFQTQGRWMITARDTGTPTLQGNLEVSAVALISPAAPAAAGSSVVPLGLNDFRIQYLIDSDGMDGQTRLESVVWFYNPYLQDTFAPVRTGLWKGVKVTLGHKTDFSLNNADLDANLASCHDIKVVLERNLIRENLFAMGLIRLDFDTPFYYNGSDPLLVDVEIPKRYKDIRPLLSTQDPDVIHANSWGNPVESSMFAPSFLATRKVDFFIRDSMTDTGESPIGACPQSPDIITRRNLVADPETEFGNINQAILNEDVMIGNDNYIYLRVHNRGDSTATVRVKVFFTPLASSVMEPENWTFIGETEIPDVEPEGSKVSDAIVWENVGDPGDHTSYCLIALLDHPLDPQPNTKNINSTRSFIEYMRDCNNASFVNIHFAYATGDGDADVNFNIQGSREEAWSDIEIDVKELPAGSRVELVISPQLGLNPWIERQNLRLIKSSLTPDKVLFRMSVGERSKKGVLRHLPLRTKDPSLASLRIRMPEKLRTTRIYPLHVIQKVGKEEVGKITVLVHAIPRKKASFLGTKSDRRYHKAECPTLRRKRNRDLIPFPNMKAAKTKGYDLAHCCLNVQFGVEEVSHRLARKVLCFVNSVGSAEELHSRVKEISHNTARRIFERRRTLGRFSSLQQLMETEVSKNVFTALINSFK